MTVTAERRLERWRECAEYIARGGTVPSGRALAKRAGARCANYNTSVWISALGKMLEAATEQERKRKKAKKFDSSIHNPKAVRPTLHPLEINDERINPTRKRS